MERSKEDILLERIYKNNFVKYGFFTIVPHEMYVLQNHGLVVYDIRGLETYYRATSKGMDIQSKGGFDKYKERMSYEDIEHALKVELMNLGITSLSDLRKQSRNSRILSCISIAIAALALVVQVVQSCSSFSK